MTKTELHACTKALKAMKQTMCPNGLYFKDEWPMAYKGFEKIVADSKEWWAGNNCPCPECK